VGFWNNAEMPDSEAIEVEVPNSRSFHGKYRYGVDSGRRVMIPKAWRPDDPKAVFVAVLWPIRPVEARDLHLVVLPPDEWQTVLRKMKSANLTDQQAAQLERTMASRSAPLALDKVWRFGLPEDLCNGAGISKEAQFVGRLRMFEIWCPERYRADLLEDEAIAAQTAVSFGL
jgi:division/cell wall cluster transcriptional repressor MraZ